VFLVITPHLQEQFVHILVVWAQPRLARLLCGKYCGHAVVQPGEGLAGVDCEDGVGEQWGAVRACRGVDVLGVLVCVS
jgi:hypothetical protein